MINVAKSEIPQTQKYIYKIVMVCIQAVRRLAFLRLFSSIFFG